MWKVGKLDIGSLTYFLYSPGPSNVLLVCTIYCDYPCETWSGKETFGPASIRVMRYRG